MSKNPNYIDVVEGTLRRVLNQHQQETQYVRLSNDLTKNYAPVYFVQDDFTVATLVRVVDSVTVAVGVSKRNAGDPKLPIRGKSLSLSRAVRSLVLARLAEIQKAEAVSIEESVKKYVEKFEFTGIASKA